MTAPTARHRPFGVSLLSILFIIAGALDVGAGIFALFQSDDDDFLAGTDAVSGDVTTYGIVAIIFGIAVVLVGFALRNGANWARYLVGIIAAFRLGALIWVVIAYHNVHWYNAFWPVAIYAFVAGYLFFDKDSAEYFEGR